MPEDVLIEEGSTKGVEKFPKRLARMALGHVQGQQLAAYLEDQGDREAVKRAKNLRGCGTWLHFQHYYTVDEVRLVGARFCQQPKLCVNCARRRSAKMLRRYSERVMPILAERRDLVLYLLSVTCKNRENLRGMHDHMWGNFQRWLSARRSFISKPHKNPYTALAVFEGGVVSGEVKRGRNSGLWHEHLHAAVLAPKMSEQQVAELNKELRAEWLRLTGDSFEVHLEPFDYVLESAPATLDNVCSGLVEVLKYTLKLNELSWADRWEAHRELHGARMLRGFGLLFGVEPPADLLDAPLVQADLPYVDWFYRFKDGAYQLEDVAPIVGSSPGQSDITSEGSVCDDSSDCGVEGRGPGARVAGGCSSGGPGGVGGRTAGSLGGSAAIGGRAAAGSRGGDLSEMRDDVRAVLTPDQVAGGSCTFVCGMTNSELGFAGRGQGGGGGGLGEERSILDAWAVAVQFEHVVGEPQKRECVECRRAWGRRQEGLPHHVIDLLCGRRPGVKEERTGPQAAAAADAVAVGVVSSCKVGSESVSIPSLQRPHQGDRHR